MKFFATVAAMALSIAAVDAGLDSCLAQSNCLRIQVHDAPYTPTFPPGALPITGSPACGSCQKVVCIKVDYSKPGCGKSGSDTISHACKSSGSCPPLPGVLDVAGTKLTGFGNGQELCQVVPNGGTAQFIVKDGSSCAPANFALDGFFVQCGTMAYSGFTPTSANTCSGSGNWDQECLWRVSVPTGTDLCGGGFGGAGGPDPCNCEDRYRNAVCKDLEDGGSNTITGGVNTAGFIKVTMPLCGFENAVDINGKPLSEKYGCTKQTAIGCDQDWVCTEHVDEADLELNRGKLNLCNTDLLP